MLDKLGAHRTATSQIIKLREEITDLTNQIGTLEANLKADGDPAAGLTQALADLKKIHDQRADRTRQWASEIERLSSRKIKAAVTFSHLSLINAAINLDYRAGSRDRGRGADAGPGPPGPGRWLPLSPSPGPSAPLILREPRPHPFRVRPRFRAAPIMGFREPEGGAVDTSRPRV